MMKFSSHIITIILLVGAFALGTGKVYGQPDEILLGIEPEHNIFDQVARYRYLADYLTEQLGVKVNLTVMSRYGEVIKRFKVKNLDGAFLSSYTATMGIKELGLEPVVYPVNLRGESTSRGVLFVRSDSGIESVEDMRGKRIVFVDPATTEGYLFPLAYLHQHGVTDINLFFNEQFYFSGSHASAVFSVLDGRSDIGAAKNTVLQRLIRNDPSIASELRIIAESIEVPEVTLCLGNKIDKSLRERMKTVLLQMEKSKEGKMVLSQFEAVRFIEADRQDFVAVDKLAQEAWAGIMEHGKN